MYKLIFRRVNNFFILFFAYSNINVLSWNGLIIYRLIKYLAKLIHNLNTRWVHVGRSRSNFIKWIKFGYGTSRRPIWLLSYGFRRDNFLYIQTPIGCSLDDDCLRISFFSLLFSIKKKSLAFKRIIITGWIQKGVSLWLSKC